VNQKAENVDVNEPSMPRKRKVPKRFQFGDAEHVFPYSFADHYRHTFFEALDLVIHCVKDRFDQPGIKVLRNVEDLIVKATSYSFEYYSEEFLFVTEFYSDDVNKDTLKVQLETLKTHFSEQPQSPDPIVTLTLLYAQASTYIAGDLLRCRGTYTNLTDNASYKCHKREDVLCASENYRVRHI
jgi:hypothetical protein